MTDESAAFNTLVALGYKQISFTGFRWLGCLPGEPFHTGFEAKSPGGVWVSGTVCSGWIFLGTTVRLDG